MSKSPDQTWRMREMNLNLSILRMLEDIFFLDAANMILNVRKTYRPTCAPNEDSDQPAYPHSLVRVLNIFVVRMKNHYENTPIQIYWKFYNQK